MAPPLDPPSWSAVVVMPFRDEAERIGDAVTSVARALGAGARGPGHLVLVDDGSTDGSAETAVEAWRSAGCDGRPELTAQLVRTDAGTAGGARRVGGRSALARTAADASAWLLSTDADCIVPCDWVSRLWLHADAGAVAVAGTVSLADDADGRRIADRWTVEYGATLRADGSHPHVHAANLAIRMDVYARVGGFHALPRAEDIDLRDRLQVLGFSLHADAGWVVQTSARLAGRVDRGFAHALASRYAPT